MAIREGKWDCSYCGAVGIPGPETKCTSCGSLRDKDVKFYLPENAPEITDEAELAKAKQGPDWHCGFCGVDNVATAVKCKQCGAGAADAAAHRKVQEIPDAPDSPAPAPVRSAPVKSGSKKGLFIFLGVLLAIALGLYFFVFRTQSQTMEVTGHAWEQSIQVEKFKLVVEEKWADKMPAGVRELSRKQELFKTEKVKTGTKRVKTGTKDLGNGRFEDVYKDKPVFEERKIMKAKVRYEIERWVPERKALAKGEGTDPKWPKTNLLKGEREGAKSSSYKLLLKGPEGKSLTWTTGNQDRWKAFVKGQAVNAKVRASGGVADVKALEKK